MHVKRLLRNRDQKKTVYSYRAVFEIDKHFVSRIRLEKKNSSEMRYIHTYRNFVPFIYCARARRKDFIRNLYSGIAFGKPNKNTTIGRPAEIFIVTRKK